MYWLAASFQRPHLTNSSNIKKVVFQYNTIQYNTLQDKTDVGDLHCSSKVSSAVPYLRIHISQTVSVLYYATVPGTESTSVTIMYKDIVRL